MLRHEAGLGLKVQSRLNSPSSLIMPLSPISPLLARFLPNAVLRYAQRLRFPHVFLLTLVIFVADMLIPDFIPFADEILLGLLTLLLASWKARGSSKSSEPKP